MIEHSGRVLQIQKHELVSFQSSVEVSEYTVYNAGLDCKTDVCISLAEVPQKTRSKESLAREIHTRNDSAKKAYLQDSPQLQSRL